MAKLPQAIDFGPRPTPQTTRAVVPVRTGIAERAEAEVGRSVEDTGQRAFEFSSKFADAEARIQSQRDAVAVSGLTRQYNEEINENLRKTQTEQDISDPQTLMQFGATAKARSDELLNNFQGSESARLRLQERLDGVRSTAAINAGTLSTQVGNKKVAQGLAHDLRTITNRATEAPGEISELIESYDAFLGDAAAALPPGQEEQFRVSGRQEIIQSAVGGLLARGAHKEARNVLDKTPGLRNMLTSEQNRRLNAQITKLEFEETKGVREGRQAVDRFTAIMGRPPNGSESLELATGRRAAGKQTLSEKIAETESVLSKAAGKPVQLTQDQILQAAKIDADEGGAFGNSLTGKALDIMTDNSPSFAAGLTSPDEDRQFMAAVTQFRQPTTFQNPDTGLLETRRPELPPFVAEALQRRGVDKAAIQQAEQAQDTPDQPTGDVAEPAGAETAGIESLPPDKTIFGLAGLATGPIPAAAEALGRTPVVGQFVRTPQITQARNFIPLVQRDLVRVLQNNPRYADTERKAIEAEIDIKPAIFDDPNAFRDRLIAIDDSLEIRFQNALKTAQSNAVGRDERVQAMNVANGLVQFRATLGVPPRVKTVEEAKALPSGSLFVDPQGNVRSVP